MDSYQAIWNEDMKGNGIKPISPAENREQSQGYAMVDVSGFESGHHVIKEVYIPEDKRNSYRLVERLFNNYILNERKREKNTFSESKEVEEFLTMAIQSLPGRLTKRLVEEKSNRLFNDLQWYTYVHDLWFRQFDSENGKDLSGFEHVFIGEQKGRRLVGHHFWYKYWLEDQADVNEHRKDQIEVNDSVHLESFSAAPDMITVGYHLEAFDYQKNRFVKLAKKNSGFFVGLSPEGLLALGTLRAVLQGEVSEECIINRVHYKLELSMSPDGKSIRTFYPVYLPS
ncbi:MAG TPA: hypothetical protein VEY51_18980 [Chondromyces sp.]|nr:hypothetical protein [Chondromyces sp.]